MKAAAIAVGAAALVLAAAVRGADPADRAIPVAAAPTTHVLFMGTDLAVRHHGVFRRIEGVTRDAYRVSRGDDVELVPRRPARVMLKVDHALKLSPVSATIAKLVHAPTYTAGRDPRRKFDAASGAAAGAAAAADLAAFQAREATDAANSPGANNPFAPAGLAEGLRENAANADRAYQEALAQQSSDQYSTGVHADRLKGEVAVGNFDALEVEFQVSSPVPLEDPHVVVLATYRERGAPEGQTRQWSHVEPIPPVGASPRMVRLREGGLPTGYVLVDCTVHLYDRGREVATNVSPRRVELTREEAWQYRVIEHQSRNAGATVPPVPVLGDLPADLRARLATGLYREPLHVRVNAVGRPQGAFLDARCTRPVEDPYLVDLVAGLLFAPALEQGRPVAGIARLQLAGLEL